MNVKKIYIGKGNIDITFAASGMFVKEYKDRWHKKKEDEGIIYIQGNKCKTLEALFDEFKMAFKFPAYFGYNWNAFDECINDLDWLPYKSYEIYINHFEEILEKDNINFEIFIEVLINTLREWTQGREYDDFPTKPISFKVKINSKNASRDRVLRRLYKTKLKFDDSI